MIPALLATLLLQATPAYGTLGPTGAPPDRSQSAAPAYRLGSGDPGATISAAPPLELARTGVTVDAYDRSIERRWATEEPHYAITVRSGAAIAQSRQGQLDGGWVVTTQDGRTLYVLELVDAGEGWLEGAWRVPRLETVRPGGSGFIALISRAEGRVDLRFLEPGAAAPTVVSVALSPDGSWRGDARRGADAPTEVRMTRR